MSKTTEKERKKQTKQNTNNKGSFDLGERLSKATGKRTSILTSNFKVYFERKIFFFWELQSRDIQVFFIAVRLDNFISNLLWSDIIGPIVPEQCTKNN